MGKFNQTLTAVAACFGSCITGMLTVWPSYTIPLLTSKNTTLLSEPMSETEASLMSSLPFVGGMIGIGCTGVVIEAVGRKYGSLIFTLPLIICWVMIDFSTTSMLIMIARFIGGVGGGANCVYAPVYVSEVSEPSIKGALSSALNSFFCLGVLLSYLIGWFFSYRMVIWINLAMGAMNVSLLLIVMESPVYLLKKKREHAALKALAHYRTGTITSKNVLEEFSYLKEQLSPTVNLNCVRTEATIQTKDPEKEKLNATEKSATESKKKSSFKLLLTTPSSLRGFLVVGTVLSSQVLMGMGTVQVYAAELFSKAVPGLSADFCSVLFALVLLGGGCVTTAIADKVGRRVLEISSSVMVAVCMGSLGLLLQTSLAPAWVSAVIILLYCFCFNYGAGSVPYVLLAEVFTPEVQNIASMILVSWVFLLNFVIVTVFTPLISLIGIHGMFYFFAGTGLANAWFSHRFIPETAGLTNREIQEAFTK